MVRTTVSLGQHWHHLHMGNSWYVSWNFIYHRWPLIWNLAIGSKPQFLVKILSPWNLTAEVYTPMSHGLWFLPPKYNPEKLCWILCVAQECSWQKHHIADLSLEPHRCAWDGWVGCMFGRLQEAQSNQKSIGLDMTIYNWLHRVHRITYSHSIIFYVQFCCLSNPTCLPFLPWFSLAKSFWISRVWDSCSWISNITWPLAQEQTSQLTCSLALWIGRPNEMSLCRLCQ